METCDVLVVGGGPAGSTAAWTLQRAGADVLVIDQATFPRDKVCAGWITPPVIETLRLDTQAYAVGRTFQPITSFTTGVIGDSQDVRTRYEQPVSYGIRRCEFDDYLLRRSAARLRLGTAVKTVSREERRWVINGDISAAVVVGAGGHFCPIGRMLNGQPSQVRARPRAGSRVPDWRRRAFDVDPTSQTLYFSSDLRGYGWCFRKQGYMNIGIGRLGHDPVPKAYADFLDFLASARQSAAGGNLAPARPRVSVVREAGKACPRRRGSARRRRRRPGGSAERRGHPASHRVGRHGGRDPDCGRRRLLAR